MMTRLSHRDPLCYSFSNATRQSAVRQTAAPVWWRLRNLRNTTDALMTSSKNDGVARPPPKLNDRSLTVSDGYLFSTVAYQRNLLGRELAVHVDFGYPKKIARSAPSL